MRFAKKTREWIDLAVGSSYGIKAKLIVIFIVIKIIPVVLLSWIAWSQVVKLGDVVTKQSTDIIATTRSKVGEIGKVAVEDSVRALNLRAREDIEQLTTTTAQAVAAFLYDRDADLRLATQQPFSEKAFRRFLASRTRMVFDHDAWILAADGQSWVPVEVSQKKQDLVRPRVRDNEADWNYRPADSMGKPVLRPLYLEMTYIDLTGQERIKVTTSDLLPNELHDISRRENTYAKAETYWSALQGLKTGEIYVSDVIGPYVGSPIIGPYTPNRAKEKEIEFTPEQAAYAGKENPVGKRFQGLVRWVTPVDVNGRITGYLTLALDHRHIMEFTDHIVPTEQRFSPIKDASSGNYAFMWDYMGRSICHPREHSIVGYDPKTGDMATPWLDEELYQAWKQSGLDLKSFLSGVPTFLSPSQAKKPASALTQAGQVGLDCRYLNFAPQCAGWHELTENGGSGSFLILWSGLWKRTTAAAIPYYTGNYGQQRRGFGYVTIGANVEEFHRPAENTAAHITQMVDAFALEIDTKQKSALETINYSIANTFTNLTFMTLLMIVAVIFVAVWMASFITQQITRMIDGIRDFEHGNFYSRLQVTSRDELGSLAAAFNKMADKLQTNIAELEQAHVQTEETNRTLELRVQERTEKLEKVLNEVEILATLDSLTGIFNRRKFNEMMQLEFNRIKRYGNAASLIMLDVDHFKTINDTHGHQAGDRVLNEFASLLKDNARNVDILCRWGGEEFAILLPETNIQQALVAAEHLRHLVSTHHFSIIDQLTVSIGVAESRTDEILDQWLNRADQALYDAKNHGRNTVCVADTY